VFNKENLNPNHGDFVGKFVHCFLNQQFNGSQDKERKFFFERCKHEINKKEEIIQKILNIIENSKSIEEIKEKLKSDIF